MAELDLSLRLCTPGTTFGFAACAVRFLAHGNLLVFEKARPINFLRPGRAQCSRVAGSWQDR